MAKNKDLEFLKSNYTLRSRHKTLKNGTTIMERDYMVTSNLGGWDSITIPYSENNFKFVHRDDRSTTRKHIIGKPVKNGDSEVWTMDIAKRNIINKKSSTSEEAKNIIKPVYSSLLDFCYFGSCSEMIKASVSDIISKYPGELYVTNKRISYIDNNTDTERFLGDKYDFGELYLIDNPYNIDIYTKSISKIELNTLKNKLNYFCVSRNKYKILDKEGNAYCGSPRWIVQLNGNQFKCKNNGDYLGRVLISGDYDPSLSLEENMANTSNTQFMIYIFYYNNSIVYLTDSKWLGYHIRPIDSAVDEFYETLDDFERFLLNRDSIPLYTITIDSVEETEKGLEKSKKRFTWPTVFGWNLDVESSEYYNYLNGLLRLAEFYDSIYSNNLWRMMTHDSIKNMDLTFSNPSKNEDKEDYNIGTTRLQGLFWAIGRQFDDLKRYIDGIKSVNSLTYSQINNITDYQLKDKLELTGWEVYDPTKTIKTDTTVSGLFEGTSKEYTITDANCNFYNTLQINSKNIFNRKGTRHGIEMLLSMFGYCSYEFGKAKYMALPESSKFKDQSGNAIQWDDLEDKVKEKLYDYELNEYVVVASTDSSDIKDIGDDLDVEKLNKLKSNYSIPVEPGPNDYEDKLQGLPVKDIVFGKENESGETEYKHYMIPWFDKTKTYDGNTYFQMYGGWGDISFKTIESELAPKIKNIVSEKNFKIYSETKKYIGFKTNIHSLLHSKLDDLYDGNIYYVEDIKDIEHYNSGVTNPSHYFILNNKYYYAFLNDDGWKNIPVNEIETATGNGIKVLYLESLVDSNLGNNPHVGYGKYDDGEEYLNRFRQLFKYKIDTDDPDIPNFTDEAYDCVSGETLDEIKKCGFTLSDKLIDNSKIWYFTPTVPSDIKILTKDLIEVEDINTGELYNIYAKFKEASYADEINVGKKAYENKQTKLTTELEAYNFETGETGSTDEAAANSIINVKNLEIKFNARFSTVEGFNEYLYNVIIPYVNQIIPSTTITKIYIDGIIGETTCYTFAEPTGVVGKDFSETRIFSEQFNHEDNPQKEVEPENKVFV